MKVAGDAAQRAFLAALESTGATRIKQVRTRPLEVGARTRLVLFVGEGERSHPRMIATIPPATDPHAPPLVFDPEPIPRDAAALGAALREQLEAHAGVLAATDIAELDARAQGACYRRNSVRGQRHSRFFAAARKALARWVQAGHFAKRHRAAALRVIREHQDAALIGVTQYDDVDSGTYHSYGRDAPFVHYLEDILEHLPAEGTKAMARLQPAAQQSVRRQREQARAHLDAIMRSKYAFTSSVDERDVETSLGALLIDRETRQIVSIEPESDPAVPRYELLRIDPAGSHRHAGAWVYRDEGGGLRLPDGKAVRVAAAGLRRVALEPEALSFARAPGDRRLRRGIAFDWDDDGVIATDVLDWVSWAGHCDVKAVMEALGLVLDDRPRVTEFRSDSGRTQVFDRALLLEMAASVIALGSDYQSIDGTYEGEAGERRFGGARNDAQPDRLVFRPRTGTRGVRWPATGLAASLRVTKLRFADGEQADLGTVFSRWVADVRGVDFAANPRHVRNLGGDEVEIDVTGAAIEAEATFAEIDRRGNIVVKLRRVRLDLGGSASAGVPVALGSVVTNAGERRISRYFYDPRGPALIRRDEWAEPSGRGWRVVVSADEHRTPLSRRGGCGLAREIRRDDPVMYQVLIDAALRQGQPICADTDAEAPVWNGLVTALALVLERENPAANVQLWRVDITARFGEEVLRYMVRRNAQGEAVDYCPVKPPRGKQWPDFLWSVLPDVASKAKIDGRWMVNRSMAEHGVVTVEPDRSVEGGFYVHDDHIKNLYELMFCALSEFRWTIVHDGKRYGFAQRERWAAACRRISTRSRALKFVR